MKWKTAMILCLMFFTSVSTIALSLNTPKLNLHESFKETLLDSDPLPQTPAGGDPVGGGGGPH